MKKVIALILAGAFVLGLAGCGKSGSDLASGQQQGNTAGLAFEDEISGEITVSCYDTMQHKSFLEDAARLFEEKYPGTTVNVETFSAMPEVKTSEGEGGMVMAMITMEDDPQAKQDYIDKVSTDLMRGAGADILAMDVLPYYRYAESGSLEDLSAYMERDPEFHTQDYRMNILDATRYGGGQYILPLDYSFEYYAYDSTLLGEDAVGDLPGALTLAEMFDAAAPHLKNAVDAGTPAKMLGVLPYAGGRGSDLFDRLLSENISTFVDLESKIANFGDGAFERMLELVKEYEDAGYLRDSMENVVRGADIGAFAGPGAPSGPQMAGEIPANSPKEGTDIPNEPAPATTPSASTAPEVYAATGQGGGRDRDERYVYKSKNNFSLYQYFNSDNTGLRNSISTGADNGNEDDDLLLGLPSDSQGGVPFSYSQAYGINSNSQNKSTAWAFIKFLLSEDIQSGTSFSPTSLPVNRAAWDTRSEWMASGRMFGGMAASVRFNDGDLDFGQEADPSAKVELTDEQRQVLERYSKQLDAYSEQLNTCPIRDTTIDYMIRNEAAYFFNGSKTAGEVANNLQSRVSLYLNE